MGRSAPTALAKRLMAAAVDAKVRLSASQLAHWTDNGLAPAPERRSHGRGRGTTSQYTDEETAYVLELARRATTSHPADEIVLWMFVDGVAVPEACVRQAYALLLNRLYAFLERNTPKPLEGATALPQDLAGELAAVARRSRTDNGLKAQRQIFSNTFDDLRHEQRWTDDDEGDGIPSRGAFIDDSRYTMVLAAIAPDETSEEALEDLTRAWSSHGDAAAYLPPDAPTLPTDELRTRLAMLNVYRLAETAQTAPIELLQQAASAVHQAPEGTAFEVGPTTCPDVGALLAPLLIVQFAIAFTSEPEDT